MPDVPKLSICVPSRNRQDCFRQTIIDLTANKRGDIEFVFADNSDDPDVMNDFMRGLDDPRIVYLPSQKTALSIIDNWERTVAAATGAWVCVIGDDDYVETDLPDYIDGIEARDGTVEAIGWNRSPYQWIAARSDRKSIPFSLANRIQRHTQDQLTDRLFGWRGATYMPQCPYGLYHGAVPRRTLDRILAEFSGRFFEHHTVDYDFSHKLVSSSENFIYINRPMSILGVSPSSGSAAVGDAKRLRRIIEAHQNEAGRRVEDKGDDADIPFGPDSGVAGNIVAAQMSFKRRYGFEYPGWEQNFARAAVSECQLWTDPESYQQQYARMRSAFEKWEGGKYLELFDPHFTAAATGEPYWGLRGDHLHISQEVAGVDTPYAFYQVLKAILPERAEIAYAL